MLNPELYIHAAAAIAPEAQEGTGAARLTAREPDYSGVIPPMQLRRMSKGVRMGISAAQSCLRDAGLENPNAITVGTAFGCLSDTEVFLRKMVEQDEQMLTPTAFIQSTHNTVAGQIALAIGCHGYTNTIAQHGHSFEGAVMSAALHLSEHPEERMLCGGFDELTDIVHGLMQRIGVYTRSTNGNIGQGRGAVAGEGAGFLLVSKSPVGARACINGLEVLTDPSPESAAGRIRSVLEEAGGLRNTDLLLTGAAGDWRSSIVYASPLSHGIPYRQQTGAWGTDVAVAIARLVNDWPEEKHRAWIVTHWGHHLSMWMLERA